MLNFKFAHLFALVLFAMASLVPVAPALAQDDEANASEGEDNIRRCMFARNVDDFHVIDRNHIVLIDRRPGTFLLGEMRPACWDIERAPGIALRHRSSSVCAGDTTILEVMSTLQSRGEQCHVFRLQAVSSVEAAVLLVESENEERNDDP